MQKRGFFLIFLLVLTLFLISCRESPSYGEALKVPSASLESRQEQVQREAVQRFGAGTTVTLDSQGKPAMVVGKIAIKTKQIATISENTLSAAAQRFLTTNRRFLQLNPADLRPVRSWCDKPVYPGKKEGICSIFYQQYYRGIPVYLSLVGITTNDGKVVLVQNKQYKRISIATTPTLPQADAIIFAQRHLQENVQPQQVSVVIYPEEKEDRLRFYLAYRLDMPPIWKAPYNATTPLDDVPLAMTYFIDAHTGNIISYHNRIAGEIEGTVQGAILPEHRLQEKVVQPFAYEKVIAGTEEAVTNNEGVYSAATPPETAVGITTQLNGSFATVANRAQAPSRYTAQGWSPSTHNIDWSQHDVSYEQEESNAFYHTNVIHDFVTKGDPFDVREMDYPLEVAVEELHERGLQCNAYSWCNPWRPPGTSGALSTGRSGVAFFGPGDRCDSIALSADVIYHEYTHSVICNVYPEGLYPYWDESGGLNEGFADYFGATISGNSCMSDYFFREEYIDRRRAENPDDYLAQLWPCLRNLENEKQYPDDYNPEPHDASEVFSASLWDLRQALGAPLTDELVMRTMKLLPFRFQDAITGLLVVDDDNANLNDGTPHGTDICQAFAQHGLSAHSCSGYLSEPLVQLITPAAEELMLGKIQVLIRGTILAESGKTFREYVMDYAPAGTEEWSSVGVTLMQAGSPIAYNEPLATLSFADADLQGQYTIRLRATDTLGRAFEVRTPVFIFTDGWPALPDRWIKGTQALVTDLENDGQPEIIITDQALNSWLPLYFLQVAYTPRGEALFGFISSYYQTQHLSAGDIDHDGTTELVSQASASNNGIQENSLLIFDPNEGYQYTHRDVPIFTFRTRVLLDDEGRYTCRPTLADLDGDGLLEIAMRTKNKLWLFSQDGSLIPGWPKEIAPSPFDSCLDGNTLLAVADLDGDGKDDLIVAEELQEQKLREVVPPEGNAPNMSEETAVPISGATEFPEGQPKPLLVHAWKMDGSPVAGWPVSIPVADISTLLVAKTNVWEERRLQAMPFRTMQGEGTPIPPTLNIVVGGGNTLFVIQPSGEIISEFSGSAPFALEAFVLGDLARNGGLSLLTDRRIFDEIGQPVAVYEFPENGWGSAPRLADSDGDSRAEILQVLATNDPAAGGSLALAGIAAYGEDGKRKQLWNIPDDTKIWQSLIVDDLNADGKADMIFLTENGLIFIPSEGAAEDIQWGQNGGDDRQTNFFMHPPVPRGLVERETPVVEPVERESVQDVPRLPRKR